MKIAVELTSDEINAYGFPVVVEGWDKRLGGRVKRAWLKEFPEKADRDKAIRYYKMFHHWYLVKGTPVKRTFLPDQLVFMQRLCNFFGTI